jgi:PiT family inorganic phosphate transporter
MDPLLVFIIVLIIIGEVVNGWTDAPNAIATVISTRALTPRVAILLATSFNIAGAFSGTAVATTIGTGIVRPEAINLITMGAAMLALILWGVGAWRLGLPVSKSHALISGLSGAGVAVAGPTVLIWEGWEKVLIGLIFSSLLGVVVGWAIAKWIQLCFAQTNPSKSRNHFRKLQMLSAASVAFSHGSNDGQKFMGAFSLALLLGGIIPTFYIPYWVILICAVTMGIGTSVGGMRIVKTLGIKLMHLETYQGFSAETAAASTILVASHFGIPLSTTHTIGTAIAGVGLAKHRKLLRWGVFTHIIYAWIFTFPVCFILAYGIAKSFYLFGIE